MEEIKSREQIISFMQEMMVRFTSDHVSDLMKNRRVDECEELASEYIQDQRFDSIAQYLIMEGAIDASVEDFKTEDQMNILMFFHCFKNYYGDDRFTELYFLSEESYTEFVKGLARSKDEVAKETAELLMEDEEDIDSYVYNEESWHIVDLTMGELINYDDPADRFDDEEDEEEADSEEEESSDEVE